MFLKELFLFSRMLFISFLSFIVLFIFLNIKWGVVAFPINEYGMYSGKLYISDTQQVYQIYANDKLVDFATLSMSQRDKLQYSLDFYKNEKINNVSVYLTIKRILNKFLIGKLMKEENYLNHTDTTKFYNWFSDQLGNITGIRVSRLAIYSCNYCWRGDMFQPVSEPIKIISVEPFR